MGGPRISQHIRRDQVQIRGAAKAKTGPPGGAPAPRLLRPRRDLRRDLLAFFYKLWDLDDTSGHRTVRCSGSSISLQHTASVAQVKLFCGASVGLWIGTIGTQTT